MKTVADFKFALGQTVKIVDLDETGIVIGRSQFIDDPDGYHVRYVDSNGAVRDWSGGEAALEAA